MSYIETPSPFAAGTQPDANGAGVLEDVPRRHPTDRPAYLMPAMMIVKEPGIAAPRPTSAATANR